jgi:hypothetical protein
VIRAALIVVALTGCDSLFSIDHVSDPQRDASLVDGNGDGANGDTPDGPTATCLKTAFGHNLCPSVVGGPMVFGTETIDSGTDMRCNSILQGAGAPELCVIAASSITISGDLFVKGTRPVVLWSSGTIMVTGSVDVSSHSTLIGPQARRGAGASVTGCTPGPAAKQSSVTGGGGGGAGGSFVGLGGVGGNSDTDTARLPVAATTPTAIRGGCAGGAAGGDLTGAHAGTGGDSGGAMYLIAATSIDVSGGLYAWGAAGYGGAGGNSDSFAGAGGGGSGGFIGLDAMTVTMTAASVAIAQGGAGGGGASGATPGAIGGELTPTSGVSNAPGGIGPGEAGAGGESSGGGSDSGLPGNSYGMTMGGGGGGGGGGMGTIVIQATNRTMLGVVSPLATLL